MRSLRPSYQKLEKIPTLKKGVATEQIPQGAELVSFDFSIPRVILELSIAKLEFTDGLQAPVHNWPDYIR